MQPTVDIILSVYNNARFVPKVIQSIQNQKYKNWRLIITDNGSTDNSYEILQSLAKDHKQILLYRLEQNMGISGGYNNCLKYSDSKYVAIMCADDQWHQDKLARQVSYIEQDDENLAAVFTVVKVIDENNQKSKNPLADTFNIANMANRYERLNFFFNKGNFLCFPSALIKRSILEKLGGFKLGLACLLDLELWVRISIKHELAVIAEPLTYYTIQNNQGNVSSATVDNKIRNKNEYKHLLKNYLAINSADELRKIFPTIPLFTNNELCHFYLAMQAIKQKHQHLKAFGVDLLLDIMDDNSLVQTILNETKLQINDLHGMLKSADIYRTKKKNKNHFIKVVKTKILDKLSF